MVVLLPKIDNTVRSWALELERTSLIIQGWVYSCYSITRHCGITVNGWNINVVTFNSNNTYIIYRSIHYVYRSAYY